MSNLYQDAILDAKALRASAMANAKAALEEAFEPKIQEMISKKLAEEADEENMEEAMDMEDGAKVEEAEHMQDKPEMEESEGINEAELEEILSQLKELETQNEAPLNEAEEEEGEEEETEEEETEEEGEGEEEGESEEAPEGEQVTDETKVIEITVGDLKQILLSVMQTPSAEPEGPEAGAEADIDLEEILDELSAEGMEDGVHQEEAINEDLGVFQDPASLGVFQKIAGQMSPEAVEALKVVIASFGGAAGFIAALKALIPSVKDFFAKRPFSSSPAPKNMEEKKHDMEEAKHKKEDEKELKEAKATIETLRKDLQEVNLLNAKYLYMNKLFKSKSLTESEKVKVINALDRATNVKEVKITYETLKESFEKKKQPIKESIGFASKPAGVAPKANIMEADQFISRWQKLAGIK